MQTYITLFKQNNHHTRIMRKIQLVAPLIPLTYYNSIFTCHHWDGLLNVNYITEYNYFIKLNGCTYCKWQLKSLILDQVFQKTLNNKHSWFLALIDTPLHQHCCPRLDFDENLNKFSTFSTRLPKCVIYMSRNREKIFSKP